MDSKGKTGELRTKANKMKKVSIIIPVIRPEKARRCIDAAIQNSGLKTVTDIEIIDMEDGERIGCPEMVKKLTKCATHDLVCFLGDDCIPKPDFLINAIHEMNKFSGEWGVVGLNDGNENMIPTHWLAHKRMLEHLDGEFFHTGYTHCYCDNELWVRSQQLDRYRFCKSAKIEHDNAVSRGDKIEDEDLKRVYSDTIITHDRYLYARRKHNNWKTPKATDIKFAIGLPIAGRQNDNQFWLSFMRMHKPDFTLLTPGIEIYEFGRDIAALRNALVEQAIDSGCTHLCMMDTDQIYPENTLEKLCSHGKKVVSAPVHSRYPPYDAIMSRKDENGTTVFIKDEEVYSGKLIPVDTTGTGCILYDIDVFLNTPQPWYELTQENGRTIGEDVNFCRKLNKIGERIWVDTSIRIDHLATLRVNRSVREIYKAIFDSKQREQNQKDCA